MNAFLDPVRKQAARRIGFWILMKAVTTIVIWIATRKIRKNLEEKGDDGRAGTPAETQDSR
jgi:hypothetical protein